MEAWPAQSPESQGLAHVLEKHRPLCHGFRECQGWLSLLQLGMRGGGV